MSAEIDWVAEIFHQALEIGNDALREQFLIDACQGNSGLQREVQLLLRAHHLAGDFMQQPAQWLDCGAAPAATEHPSHNDDNLEATRPPQQDSPIRIAGDPVALPRQFGDYELLEKIASGGMGVVYKARQNSLNRIVALKMILSGQLASDDEVRRFYREAEAAAHLDHPGVVPVFDVGCTAGQHYFSMGYVEGNSLDQVVKRGPLAPREAAKLVRKIAVAVHAAHQQGIIHRDLKPGNVLLDLDLEPRVTDFGLAKQVQGSCDLTMTGMVIGTPGYMPPEQALGNLPQIREASDVYSLGAILFALLTGQAPFRADNQVDTLIKVIHEQPIAPRQLVKNTPKDLEAICLKCLEKQPVLRYPTAEALAADIDRFLAGEPVSASNDWLRRLRKWSLREPVLVAHLAAIAVMMLFIFFNYLVASDPTESRRVLLVNYTILAAWAVVATALQKVHNRISSKHLIPLLWAAANPLLLTGALVVNDAPREILFAAFLFLVVTTGFFRRVELVVATTVSCLLGYVLLLVLFPNPDIPKAYQVLFAVILSLTGLMLGFQVLRLNRIAEIDRK